MRILFLLVSLLTLSACGNGTASGFHDPIYYIFVKPGFSTPYADSLNFRLTAHAIEDAGNPDPGSVPPDYSINIRRDQCTVMAAGSNANDVRLHFVFTVVPIVGASGGDHPYTVAGPTFQSDTLDPSPATVPYSAPWGDDEDHPLIWKMGLTDASDSLPALVTLPIDTMNRVRLPDACVTLFP
jgi:hypothetical protein